MGQLGEGGAGAEAPVHVVTEYKQLPLPGDPVDGRQMLRGVDDASGVIGGVENQDFGFGREGRFQGRGRKLEAVFGGVHRHRHGPGQAGHGVVQAEGRGGNDHLIAWVQDPGEGGVNGLRGPQSDEDLLRSVIQAPAPAFKLGNGLAQGQVSPVFRVVGAPLVQGVLAGLSDGNGSVEFRLPQGEENAVSPFLCQGGEAANAPQGQAAQLVVELGHTNSSPIRVKRSAPRASTPSSN